MLLALALLLALFQAPTEAERAPFELAFRWPESGAVTIDELHSKPNLEIAKRYVLRWQPEPEGKSLVFDFTDFELVRYGEASPSDPGVEQALRFVEPLLRAMPRWRISRAGAFEGHVDFVAGIERLIASGRASGSFDAGAESMLRAMIADPETRLRHEQRSGETWQLWAGAWAGVTLAVGETRAERTRASSGADTFEAAAEMRCLERLAHAGKDCVRLELVTRFDGDDYLRAAERRIAAALPADASGARKIDLLRARKETTLRGIYEVSTLRPHEVTSIVVDEFELAGLPAQRQEEKRVYLFDWQKKPASKPAESPR